MKNLLNKLIINYIGRDLTEYISSNTMNVVTKKVNPFIWTYDLKALVVNKYSENNEVIILDLLPNQHWKDAKPGQYIKVKLLIEGKEYRNSYLISSIKDSFINITINMGKDEVVSKWIHQHLKVGMTFDISGPFDESKIASKPKIFPRVYFKHYNKQLQLTEKDQGKSLLQLGIENGLNLERGCKRGICGTCKLILHEGCVEGNKLGNAVYICTAFPASELVVLGT
jgi:hypothetical protein